VATQPINIIVNEGESAQFFCEYYLATAPVPTVTWRFSSFRGTETLKEGILDSRSGRSRLQLQNVTTDGEGNYTCLIENEFKSVESSPALLTVRCKGSLCTF
jgi:hypothetical protein